MVNEIVRTGLSRGGNNHPVLKKKADYKCLHSKPVLPNNPQPKGGKCEVVPFKP